MPKPFVSTKGFLELGQNMRTLKAEVALKICRKATGKAAQIIKKAAIIKAPIADEAHTIEDVVVPVGNLKKNIIAKRIKSPLTSEHIVTVRGKAKYAFASRYGSMQEFGTVKQTAKPFMRPAFDENKNNAVEAIRSTLDKEIQKTANSLPK